MLRRDRRPGLVVVISNYRVTNPERSNFAAKVFDFPLFIKLRRVHANNGQALVVINDRASLL